MDTTAGGLPKRKCGSKGRGGLRLHRRHHVVVLVEQLFAVQHHLMGADAIEPIFPSRQRTLAGVLEFFGFRHQPPAHLDDSDVAGAEMLQAAVDDRAGQIGPDPVERFAGVCAPRMLLDDFSNQ